MERILIVTVNWLGDAIMTTPVPAAIKERYPDAYVAVLSPQRVAGVFENNPYVNEVISFDDTAFKKSVREKIRLIRILRSKKFNTAFLIHRSFSRTLICWAAGIKHRIGYSRLKTFFLLTQRVPLPSKTIHRQDYYLYLFEKAGVPVSGRLSQFYISNQAADKMNGFLAPIRRNYRYLAGINPSANWELKRWPVLNFAWIADKLITELNCAIFFIGADRDRDVITQVLANMTQRLSYNMCGKTNLDELAVLMKSFDLFISNDSGPAHLAAALGINTFVLFGPTVSAITGQRGKNVKLFCRLSAKEAGCKLPCYNLNCKNNICMQNIDKNDIFNEAKKILLNKNQKT